MGNVASLLDEESSGWQDSEEFHEAVAAFHAIYAMPPEKLEKCKGFHERVLYNCFESFGFCTDLKKIGGSYEGVKVVKSETEDDFEFDVMFVLEIPEECRLEIVEMPGRPGYALLKVTEGARGMLDYFRATNRKFFAGCLAFENGIWIVDAGKTISAFFGKLQRWINTDPVPWYKLRAKQHGTAIQMDVFRDGKFYYSVDIAPTFEIIRGDKVQRYVAKPEKKRTPDSITWRRLFNPKQKYSDVGQHASNIFQSAVRELRKQLSKYCASCNGKCQGSCFEFESIRTSEDLPYEYMLKLQRALAGQDSAYRLTFINLQDLNSSINKRLVAIHYFFRNELEVIPVFDKPDYAWLKFGEDASSACSRFSDELKLCYHPHGKYLDIKAASDLFVAELKDVVKHLFRYEDVMVRRDGPIVRIEVYPEVGNTMSYYCLDIVLAAYVNGNFYIGLPHDYDDTPDKTAWRRSYSYEETTKIQRAPEGLKSVFRILKALRNREPGLAPLTSYHFKTLLLNMQYNEHMKYSVVWNENLADALICALKYLKACLNKKELQTHFLPEINLLENMTNDCCAHMENRIDELLRSRKKMLKALKSYMD